MITNTLGDPTACVAAGGFDIAELLTPSAYRHPVYRPRMCETNLSWVILTGPFAYKVKKAVQLDFVDASTLAKRRHLCEEELRLNRRLAAALYLDVISITREDGHLRVDGDGHVVEYAVRMRQFDSSEELCALLERGEVSQRELADLGERLAAFHANAPTAACSGNFTHTEDLHDAVLGNLATLLSHLGPGVDVPELGFLIDWTHDYLHQSLPQLRMREQCGAIRECHGDLHARNIVRWCGQLVPFDCLEFAPKLRWIDVMNDVAFLQMDLTAHGRKDLAFAFLNAYLERTGDYAGVRHLSFYSVYRALVRAMVDSLGAESDAARRREFQNRLRMRVKAAAQYVNRSAPTLFIMHGLSGSGKSWLSERLASRLGAVRMRSDVERRRLNGSLSVPSLHDRAYEEGPYAPEMSRRTYARLLESAESCLKGGMDTIVDAAFLTSENRRSFRDLAEREGVPFIILSCEADPVVLAQRVQERADSRIGPSDAGPEVLKRQLQDQQRLCPQEQPDVIQIDTTQASVCETAVAAIREHLHSAKLRLPAA